jgi:hypothetical protein
VNPNDDPIEILREANPHPTQAPPGYVRERIWARVEARLAEPRQSLVGRWGLAAGGLATVAAALALVAVMGRPAATSGPSVALGDAAAMCIEVYTPENLLHRQVAFDGTVTAITDAENVDFGSAVTFDVNRAYIGDLGDTVTLTASGMGADIGDSEGGPPINVGDRLLVSGDEGNAWTCGFTRTYSDDMAAEWEAATR